MNAYQIVLFVHIVGAILLFTALTVEGLSYRFGFSAAELNRVVGPVSGLAVLLPGLYLTFTQWGWKGWIVFGLVAWLVIASLGGATGVALLREAIDRRTAVISWVVRVAIALVVVFDMTVKPGSVVS